MTAVVEDAFTARVVDNLREWCAWGPGIPKSISEFGWPLLDNPAELPAWRVLGKRYLDVASELGVSYASVWEATNLNPGVDNLEYVGTAAYGDYNRAMVDDVAVLTEPRTVPGLMSGLDLTQLTGGFIGNTITSASFDYIGGTLGFQMVELLIQVERLGDAFATSTLVNEVAFAKGRGMHVVVRLFNSDDTQTMVTAWQTLIGILRQGGVYDMVDAFDICNEYYIGDADFQNLTQAVVNGIRAAGSSKFLWVPGNGGASMKGWTNHHPVPWIVDTPGLFGYTAHDYWYFGGGSYADGGGYAGQLSLAQQAGFVTRVVQDPPTAGGTTEAESTSGSAQATHAVSTTTTVDFDDADSLNAGFITREDAALKAKLQGIRVPVANDRSDGGVDFGKLRAVPVFFRLPEDEVRRRTYPYITIDFLTAVRDVEREHRGVATYGTTRNAYTPSGMPAGGGRGELPVPMRLEYQVTSYARYNRHDRAIMTALAYDRLEPRFGFLEMVATDEAPDDNSIRRLDLLAGPTTLDGRDDQGKRLFRKSWTVGVSSELFHSDIHALAQVGRVNLALLQLD